MKRYRSCQGCRAYFYSSGLHNCQKGYEQKLGVPMEPCPKPRTNKELVNTKSKWEQAESSKVYEKLVRDRIPEIIEKNGEIPLCEILDDTKKKLYLKKKLQEEVKEFLADESIEEMADVCEVIATLLSVCGWSESQLRAEMQRKRENRGGFEKGILLLSVKEKE